MVFGRRRSGHCHQTELEGDALFSVDYDRDFPVPLLWPYTSKQPPERLFIYLRSPSRARMVR